MTIQFSTRAEMMVKALPKKGIVAEIGVYTGAHADLIFRLTQPKVLHLIDPWKPLKGEIYKGWGSARRTQEEHDKLYMRTLMIMDEAIKQSRAVIYRMTSSEAVEIFRDEYFDWIFIDGDHTYQAVKDDLNNYYPKIKWGGYICGHDYNEKPTKNYGVVQAVQEFIKEHNLVLNFLTTEPPDVDDTSFGIQKVR